MGRLANALLLATGLELEDICDVPQECRFLLAPAGREDDEEHHTIGCRSIGNGNKAKKLICRLARFVVRAKEWEHTIFGDICVLGQLVRHEETQHGWVWWNKDESDQDGRLCEVFRKWAKKEERVEEVQAWVEQATDLASKAEDLLEWNGTTSVDVENEGVVRRRRT